MSEKKYDYLFKILLIGDSTANKTSILLKFCDDAFNTTQISTIGIDFKVKTFQLNSKKIRLHVWDTAGQERFKTITSAYYRGAHGILLVYSITDKESFDSTCKWMENINEHADKNVEIILLGNNCEKSEMRQVSKEDGERFAIENNIKFFEVSSKNNYNLESAFMALTSDLLLTK